jgi:hypothetical protein
VPIAWVRPRSEQYVIGPIAGRYVVSWRDFLGAEVEAAQTITVPARLTLGAEKDGGPPT